MTKKVLVTGAAGFIGRWVVAELLDRGIEVRGFDDFSSGSREKVAEFDDNDSFEMVEGDVREEKPVNAAFEGVDACVHLAAEIDVQESLDSPNEHFLTNVVGTRNVLESCRRTDTRLGLVGTCMVYDVAESDRGIDETHPVKPASPYAGTKLAAENLAESYYHGYDVPVVLMRPFNTYGPYQDGGVVPIFVDRDQRGEPLKIYGDGSQTRDLLYVTDCARFIADATLSRTAVGKVVNAGTGTDVTINELANLIATGDTAIEHVEHHHPQSEVRKLKCNPGKAAEILGWEPEVSLKKGVEHLRSWIAENGINSNQ